MKVHLRPLVRIARISFKFVDAIFIDIIHQPTTRAYITKMSMRLHMLRASKAGVLHGDEFGINSLMPHSYRAALMAITVPTAFADLYFNTHSFSWATSIRVSDFSTVPLVVKTMGEILWIIDEPTRGYIQPCYLLRADLTPADKIANRTSSGRRSASVMSGRRPFSSRA